MRLSFRPPTVVYRRSWSFSFHVLVCVLVNVGVRPHVLFLIDLLRLLSTKGFFFSFAFHNGLKILWTQLKFHQLHIGITCSCYLRIIPFILTKSWGGDLIFSRWLDQQLDRLYLAAETLKIKLHRRGHIQISIVISYLKKPSYEVEGEVSHTQSSKSLGRDRTSFKTIGVWMTTLQTYRSYEKRSNRLSVVWKVEKFSQVDNVATEEERTVKVLMSKIWETKQWPQVGPCLGQADEAPV